MVSPDTATGSADHKTVEHLTVYRYRRCQINNKCQNRPPQGQLHSISSLAKSVPGSERVEFDVLNQSGRALKRHFSEFRSF